VKAVLVSHPHVAAVSVQVAAAFERAGRLATFATGVAFNDADWTGRLGRALAHRRPVLRNRIVEEIPPDRLRSLPLIELGSRVLARAAKAMQDNPIAAYDALFAAHDAAVAASPWPRAVDGLYVYEDAALLTFRRAARRDLPRVLDVASLHYRTVESTWQDEVQRWPDAPDGPIHVEPQWKRRRKDGEAALATTISVASEFTRGSLEAAGVTSRIITTPYGFPVERFSARATAPQGPFTVLAVGAQSVTKGTTYLLEAWRKAALPDSELRLVGRMRLSKTFLDRYAGLFHHVPHVPRSEIDACYAGADLVAFPTLADGFGLVIQESMACGTPVLTTPCGGGPACISDDVDGWIVPPRDIDALVERLRFAHANRDRLHAMGKAARTRAERWTWRDAGQALLDKLEA
jgi:glycosyltransferase involved in cell wall biosynthesis